MTERRVQPTKPNHVSRKVAARIRLLRQARGWSAAKLADHLRECGHHHLDRRVIAKLELGDRAHMTVDELFAFADALNISPTGLIDDGPVCKVCNDAPPAGFVCLNCGAGGAR